MFSLSLERWTCFPQVRRRGHAFPELCEGEHVFPELGEAGMFTTSLEGHLFLELGKGDTDRMQEGSYGGALRQLPLSAPFHVKRLWEAKIILAVLTAMALAVGDG